MVVDWSTRKVADLKEECKARNISITGLKLKQQFVDKLTEYDASSQNDIPAEEPQAQPQVQSENELSNEGDIHQSQRQPQVQSKQDEQSIKHEDVAERTHGAMEEVAKDELPRESKDVHDRSLEAVQQDDQLSDERRDEQVAERIPLAVETDKDLPSERPATLKIEDSQASNLDQADQAAADEPMAETEEQAQEIKDNDMLIPKREQVDVSMSNDLTLQDGAYDERNAENDDEALAKLKQGLKENAPEEMEMVDRPAETNSKHSSTETEETRKRKRRSQSPSIDAPEVQKKAKSSQGEAIVTKTSNSRSASTSPAPQPLSLPRKPSSPNHDRLSQDKEPSPNNDSVEPALHTATRSLYLANFKRPLNIQALKSHVTSVAKGSSDADPISFFNINNIRSHAFVTFTSTAAATRVRTAMHNSRFPDDPIREQLFVDYIPDDKVEDWVEQETTGSRGSRNSNSRMEVIYKRTGKGVKATFEDTSTASTRREPRATHQETFNPEPRAAVASGVHPDRIGIVSNPEPMAPASGRQNRDLPASPPEERGMGFKDLDDLFDSTRAKPKLYFKRAPQSVIDERLDMIHDLYSDRGAPGAPNMKRYTFQGTDRQVWVDDGPEFGKGRKGYDRLMGSGTRGRGGGSFRGRGRGFANDSYHGRPRR